MSADSVAFVGALAYNCRQLLPIMADHLADHNGVVLPHLFMADVERWAERRIEGGRGSKDSDLLEVLAFIEVALAHHVDSEVGEVISVSFLEHLPRPGEPGSVLRSMVGPTCAAQLKIIG